MIRLWYACAVGAIGMLPFLAPLLESAGHTPTDTALILVSIPLGALLGGPSTAWFSDRIGVHRPLIALSLVTAALCALALTWSVVPGLVVGFSLARSAVFPLADTATVHHLGDRYGTVRAVGSVVYAVVVLCCGATREQFPTAPLWVGGCLLLGAALCTPWVPDLPERVPREAGRTLWNPVLAGVLLVALLNGMSLAVYDHLFTLAMDQRGVAPLISGAAVAWGVLVEVAVLFAGPQLLARFGTQRLLVIGAAAGIPRFLATAWLDDPLTIAALQGLHGLQFGAFWVAGLAAVRALAPPDLRRSSQALFAAAGFGLAPILALVIASWWLRFAPLRVLFAVLSVPALLATLVAAWLPRAQVR